jgi:hypothetical protein
MNQEGLSFGDGFKFGCGFITASVVATVVLGIVGGILSLLATFVGLGSMGALMGNF